MAAPILTAAQLAGSDGNSRLLALGVDPRLAQEPDARIPYTAFTDFWQWLVQRTGDPAVGIRAAYLMPMAKFGTLGCTLRHIATFGEGFNLLVQHEHLVHGDLRTHLMVEGDRVRIMHRLRSAAEGPPPALDFFFATCTLYTRSCVGSDIRPRAVHLRRQAPADTSAYERLFGAPVHFGMACDEIIFDASLVDRPVRTHDPALATVLGRHLGNMREREPGADDLLGHVRLQVRAQLHLGPPALEQVADALGFGSRSLQRRLRERGVTYQELVDATRREEALRRVRGETGILTGLAFDLGFSEVSAFYRAFRRWTGTTPAAFRRRGDAPPEALLDGGFRRWPPSGR